VNHMSKPVFIIGAGGFARETFDIYIDCGREMDILGFLEENCKNDGAMLNGKPLHDISYLNKFTGKDKPLLIGAIGSTKRKRLIMELEKKSYEFDIVIHPSSIRSRWVRIGEGSIVTSGVIMTCQVAVGRHVILNLGVHIGHDVRIGDFTTISPGAEVMGNTVLGDSVYVGTNATIIEHVNVGDGAIIAAGAVVSKDVPAMTLVAGVPAKIKKVYKSQEEKPW
jgi:sugar O-acyltransferase (sialic acid O-acetyltransferase NeuD family)